MNFMRSKKNKNLLMQRAAGYSAQDCSVLVDVNLNIIGRSKKFDEMEATISSSHNLHDLPATCGGYRLLPIKEGDAIIGYTAHLDPNFSEKLAFAGQARAIDRSMATIEFDLDGIVLTANQNFLAVLGYASLGEVKGRHHRIFVDSKFAGSVGYNVFWKALRSGEFVSGEFQRMHSSGKMIWIEASYNPVFDEQGRVIKIVKFATDITEKKLKAMDDEAKLAALSRSQAMIEFNLDGTITYANENFIKCLGYSRLSDIQGRHHRMFVRREDQETKEYQEFWSRLASGQYFVGKFRRITASGSVIWIEASYNPVMNEAGQVVKVVKFASDITKQMTASMKVASSLNMIQTVAGASEEMFASIREISDTMQMSKSAVGMIMENIAESSIYSSNLSKSAKSMENVTDIIRDISEKVNLLALNATIEAARAGASGKGFAVVAAEVKNLAGQTADAIGDIEKEIKEMQSVTSSVNGAVRKISESASKVEESVSMVASAIEEQTAVTNEISRNIEVIASGVAELDEMMK